MLHRVFIVSKSTVTYHQPRAFNVSTDSCFLLFMWFRPRSVVERGNVLLFLKHRFYNVCKLRGHTVKQNAYTVDLCGKNSDADGRSNENCNRNSNFIPRHRTHTNSRKHSHRRGERDIRAYHLRLSACLITAVSKFSSNG